VAELAVPQAKEAFRRTLFLISSRMASHSADSSATCRTNERASMPAWAGATLRLALVPIRRPSQRSTAQQQSTRTHERTHVRTRARTGTHTHRTVAVFLCAHASDDVPRMRRFAGVLQRWRRWHQLPRAPPPSPRGSARKKKMKRGPHRQSTQTQ
jgi:hypothetical protein